MTGGAIGSMIAQFFHLTSAERKTLLVAGAAAGMSATFATPLSPLSCWRSNCCCSNGSRAARSQSPWPVPPPAPRGATSSDLVRFPGSGPSSIYRTGRLAGCVLAAAGRRALRTLTLGVYAAEDSFQKLPIHWMWWPAIGGVFVGLGG